MIIDAHYHLEERMQSLAQLLDQMDRHGVRRIALIPATNDPFPWTSTSNWASALLRALLVSRLRSTALKLYTGLVTADGTFDVLGKRYPIYDTPDNATVERALQAHPDRFCGWIFINPRSSDPLAEIERWVGRPGWIGVKSHPFWHQYPVKLLDPVAGYCVEHNLPLLVHLGGDDARGDFRYLPDRHPKLNIIYAHAGVPFYYELWEYARDKPNIRVDLSAESYVGERVRLDAVRALGAHRCLAGTDGPYCNADHGRMVQNILRLPITEAEKGCILGGNMTELIGSR